MENTPSIRLVTTLSLAAIFGFAFQTCAAVPIGPYCGIYCVYGAMQHEGETAPLDFRNLVSGKYIGCPRGSSLAELMADVQDHGMHARAVADVSGAALARLPYPSILHVRASEALQDYDHYVLLLPQAGGKGVVIDPSHPDTTTTLADWLPLWDGKALIVSRNPISVASLAVANGRSLATYGALAICLLVVIAIIERRWRHSPHSLRGFGGSVVQCGLLVGAVVVASLAYNFMAEDGMFGSMRLASKVDAAFAPQQFPAADLASVKGAVHTGTPVLIDARLRRDYADGHIGKSLNIPPDSDEQTCRTILAAVPLNTRLIVYCQSPGCTFKEIIARQLHGIGYRDISIYPGGWTEWNSTPEAANSPVTAGASE